MSAPHESSWRLPAVTVAAGALLALLSILLTLWSKELLKDAAKAECAAAATALTQAVRNTLEDRLRDLRAGGPRPAEVAATWRVARGGEVLARDPADAPAPPARLVQVALAFRGHEPLPLTDPVAEAPLAATWLPPLGADEAGLLVLWDLAALEARVVGPDLERAAAGHAVSLLRDPAALDSDPRLREVIPLAPPLSFWRIGVGLEDMSAIRRNLRLQTALLAALSGWLLLTLVASVGFTVRRERASAARLLARQRFLERAYHDLQTPLALMRAAAETVQRGAVERPEDVARCVEIMTREEERLTRTIRRLLRYLRLEDAELLGAATSVRAEVEATATEVAPALAAAGLTLRVDTAQADPALCAPRELVVDVLGELLANARKHAAGGREVRVSLAPGARGRLRLVVEDDGPGLGSGDPGRLLEPGVRGAEGARPGSGLGLALVREGLQHVGGALTCGPASGGGARFEVEFPCQRT